MIVFKQLYDPRAAAHYIVNGKALVFKLSTDEVQKEVRLKKYFAAILEALFSKHPEPISYEELTNILRNAKLACPDETRLHRKMSELRQFLGKIHPGLNSLIVNMRGVGYSLPLHLQDPNASGVSDSYKIKNKTLQTILKGIDNNVKTSITLTKKCPIKKSHVGFVLQRTSVHGEVEQLLERHENHKKKLFEELRLHKADFSAIRLEFTLAKLQTYLGLARISEFSITKDQWVEWHEIETAQIMRELVCAAQSALEATN